MAATLKALPACAGHLRQHRVCGQPLTRLLDDRPVRGVIADGYGRPSATPAQR